MQILMTASIKLHKHLDREGNSSEPDPKILLCRHMIDRTEIGILRVFFRISDQDLEPGLRLPLDWKTIEYDSDQKDIIIQELRLPRSPPPRAL